MSEKTEINIFESELVPKHRVLSEEEKKEILRKYNAKLTQLPRILHTDPAVVALKAKPGDVIEIIRETSGLGKTKYYRVVVQAKKK